ncbi:hypothetical protein BGX30_002682, partial [Mortierella sp. GBA39]
YEPPTSQVPGSHGQDYASANTCSDTYNAAKDDLEKFRLQIHDAVVKAFKQQSKALGATKAAGYSFKSIGGLIGADIEIVESIKVTDSAQSFSTGTTATVCDVTSYDLNYGNSRNMV